MIIIRPALADDLDDILDIHRHAFGSDTEADLVAALHKDPSAEPILSLVAVENNILQGHILFTRAYLNNQSSPLMHILAPMAVNPGAQHRGIGMMLIQRGLGQLRDAGSKLVFVLGYPEYYPRSGFLTDAEGYGFTAPYPIPEEHADAWMVYAFDAADLDRYDGRVTCSDTLMKPEYWVE
jgi:putative acetyltransferase